MFKIKSEVSVSSNKAEILYYDLTKNEWYSPAGKGTFSRMDIFHNTSNDTYRIVAMTPKNPRQVEKIFIIQYVRLINIIG